jgi:hypothetical protein
MIPKYSRVRLTTNKYEKEGGRVGMLGYIIETYPDGRYEVEFSDANGVSIAQLVVTEDDVALASEAKS